MQCNGEFGMDTSWECAADGHLGSQGLARGHRQDLHGGKLAVVWPCRRSDQIRHCHIGMGVDAWGGARMLTCRTHKQVFESLQAYSQWSWKQYLCCLHAQQAAGVLRHKVHHLVHFLVRAQDVDLRTRMPLHQMLV